MGPRCRPMISEAVGLVKRSGPIGHDFDIIIIPDSIDRSISPLALNEESDKFGQMSYQKEELTQIHTRTTSRLRA